MAMVDNIRSAVRTLALLDTIKEVLDRSATFLTNHLAHRVLEVGLRVKIGLEIVRIVGLVGLRPLNLHRFRVAVVAVFVAIVVVGSGGLCGLALGGLLLAGELLGRDATLLSLELSIAKERLDLEGLLRLARQQVSELHGDHITKAGRYTESMAVEAHGLEQHVELIEQQRMVHWQHQLQVTQVSRAVLVHLVASRTARPWIHATLHSRFIDFVRSCINIKEPHRTIATNNNNRSTSELSLDTSRTRAEKSLG